MPPLIYTTGAWSKGSNLVLGYMNVKVIEAVTYIHTYIQYTCETENCGMTPLSLAYL